ncbi:MAG: amidohydrolase [Dehalococcoidia bacterium]
MTTRAEPATRALEAIDAADGELRSLSRAIHARPELAYEEVYAHDAITALLEAHGFAVDRSAYGLKTAFRAVAGSGKPVIAILCEYDALPGIGHACGHNLIAAAGVAAGIGAAAAIPAGQGTVVVFGTPAEERCGGKVDLINAGAFDDVDVAMMVHPIGGRSVAAGVAATRWLPTAIHALNVRYIGKNAHAGASPWEGVNALDAFVLAYNAIAVLRQQMPPSARVHGIVTRGGEAPNIIPDLVEARFFIRESTMATLEALERRVLACFEGAATATGCRLEHEWEGNAFSDMLISSPLIQAYERHAAAAGLEVHPQPVHAGGSTDMGNVSYVVPSIHPMFGIKTDDGNHTPGFTEGAGQPEAEDVMLKAAKALALTAVSVATDPALLSQARAEFRERTGREPGTRP